MNETFLIDLDKNKLQEVINSNQNNIDYFNSTCTQIVKAYSESLDNLMLDLYEECIKNENPSIRTLEKYYLELSNMIYFMIEKVENLGVYADLSEKARKEVYANTYINLSIDKDEKGKSKSTIAEMQVKADMSSQYEDVVSAIYDKAYKVIKGKVSSAQDMMNTLRKILTVRSDEIQLSTFSSNKVGGNEE